MSTFQGSPSLPGSPTAVRPAVIPEAPRNAARFLAGVDVVAAAWLVFLNITLHRASAEDAGQGTTHVDFWTTWYLLTIILVIVLMTASVSALIGSTSQPRMFRVLFTGTLTLALVSAMLITLSHLGLSL